MCFFYSKLWNFRKKKNHKKKQQKKMHIIPSWALCPTCLPFLPPLHTSPQLTETWQWPPCMCWQPKWTLLFFQSHLLGLGKILPPTSCHPWNPFGIQCWPVPLERGLPLFGMHDPAHLRCGHPDCECNAPPGPSSSGCNFPPHLISGVVMVSQGWAGNIFLKRLQKSNQSSAA